MKNKVRTERELALIGLLAFVILLGAAITIGIFYKSDSIKESYYIWFYSQETLEVGDKVSVQFYIEDEDSAETGTSRVYTITFEIEDVYHVDTAGYNIIYTLVVKMPVKSFNLFRYANGLLKSKVIN